MLHAGLYKHIHNTDVALEIKGIRKTKDGIRVIGYWVNIVNPKNLYKCTDLIVEFIKNKDIKNWNKYDGRRK